jgi:hypothetical protein
MRVLPRKTKLEMLAAFDQVISRLTDAAVRDTGFWTPRASRLAMVSGDRTIEVSRG